MENHYLNSLRYTDSVLGEIVNTVMQANQPTLVLYASDHGEYLNDYQDGFYDHGNRNHLTRFEIDIPFFLAFNESFLMGQQAAVAEMTQRTKLRVAHDNISHTVLGLLGIRDATYRPEFDLSSPAFIETPRVIIDRANKVTALENVRFDQMKFSGRLRD